jgi:hypothetical protein
LEVFDLQGRRRSLLADGEFRAGAHSVNWDRRDANGDVLRAGVFLYRIDAGGFHAERKMVLLP